LSSEATWTHAASLIQLQWTSFVLFERTPTPANQTLTLKMLIARIIFYTKKLRFFMELNRESYFYFNLAPFFIFYFNFTSFFKILSSDFLKRWSQLNYIKTLKQLLYDIIQCWIILYNLVTFQKKNQQIKFYSVFCIYKQNIIFYQ